MVKWEAMHMHGDMTGIYDRIVCLDGLTKRPRTAAHPREYARIRQYVSEFRKCGKMLR